MSLPRTLGVLGCVLTVIASLIAVPSAALADINPTLLCTDYASTAKSTLTCSNINDLDNHRNLRGVVRSKSGLTTACTVATDVLRMRFGYRISGTDTIDGSNDYTYVRTWWNGSSGSQTNGATTSGLQVATVPTVGSGCDTYGWSVFNFNMPGALDITDNKGMTGQSFQNVQSSSITQNWIQLAGGVAVNSNGKISSVQFDLTSGQNFVADSFLQVYAE